jgi:hypothetical protein
VRNMPRSFQFSLIFFTMFAKQKLKRSWSILSNLSIVFYVIWNFCQRHLKTYRMTQHRQYGNSKVCFGGYNTLDGSEGRNRCNGTSG